ncbi:MAG: hypothetical protein V1831_04305 [Candidatus Woesearchaeota archaeon]
MKKRGALNWMVIALIVLVVALFVAFSIPKIAQSLGTGKIALKTAAARDIAFVIDSIYAYPYDVTLNYDYNLGDFIVLISDNQVVIYESKYTSPENDPIPARYSFAPVKESPSFVLTKPKQIVFQKNGDKLTIT